VTWRLVVSEDAAGLRIDRYLADLAPAAVSRSRLQALLKGGQCLVDGRPQKAAYRLRGGELVACDFPVATPLCGEPMALNILFEDDALVVVNKQSGVVVHPGAGVQEGTLVQGLLAHCPLSSLGAGVRPGIVHRLDRGTSGVIVVAKTDAAHLALARQFAERSVQKRYRAWSVGRPKEQAFRIATRYGRHPTDRRRFTGRRGDRDAISQVEVDWARAGIAALTIRILTGRTHQIRVHLSEADLPVLGDTLYGGKRIAKHPFPRLALHAEELVLQHPEHGTVLRFVAPVPDDLAAIASLPSPA
jgi:23S rRNA pseudouridine1911/1915/1917 synthase